MHISAREFDFRELNKQIKTIKEDIWIEDCYGQKFIGSGLRERKITINGTPGNDLGAYLDGAVIEVNGNAQDAVGDTMNDGKIIIHGNAGDALGYAMRGGCIFIQGDAGYRTGVHMKEYKDKKPVIVIGGKVGSFLGEYLAGGLIVVLGINAGDACIGNFTGTGMYGGCIYIRSEKEPADLPAQVTAEAASEQEIQEIRPYILEFAKYFGMDAGSLMEDRFYILRPNARNPYKQLYTTN